MTRDEQTGGWRRVVAAVVQSRVLLLAMLVVVVPSLLFVRVSDGSGGQTSAGSIVIVLVVVALAVAGLVSLLSGFDPSTAVDAARLVGGDDQRRLLARWISRSRWARNIGGFAGIVAWVFATNARGDLLVFGIGGLAVGAMLAELHLTRRVDGPRSASLETRSVGDYLGPSDRTMLGATGVICVALVVVGLLHGVNRSIVAGVAGVAVLLVASGVQRMVAQRPRPALSRSLRAGDDLVRRLAINRGLARPAVGLGLALAGMAAAGLEADLGLGLAMVAIVCRIAAIAVFLFNRKLGLGRVEPLSTPVPA